MKKLLLLLLLPFTLFSQKVSIVHITTDMYPAETYWAVFADSLYGDTLGYVPAGYYTQSNTPYMDTVMIPDSITNITFLIRDTYGDGMSGSYYYSICGDTVVSYPNPSFSYGLYSNRAVPQCMANPPPPPPVSAICVEAKVVINTDQYPEETSWVIKDTLGNIITSGGPYTGVPDYQPQEHLVCLPIKPLTFTILDTYGDGMAGSLWGGQDGSYYLMQCGDTLVHGTVANFGTDSTHIFISDTCAPLPPVPGCMDENYLEYDPTATVSDSSCLTLKTYGCTDSTMFNYDSTANTMDYIDSCDYTLILHDLVGNGWVGSRLEVYQDDTSVFYMNIPGTNQFFTIQLNAPEEVGVKFFVNTQASNTTLECGFTLINPMGDTVISVVPPFLLPFNLYSGTTYCGNECVEIVEGCMDSTAWNYDSTANTPETCYYNPGCISPAYLEYHTDTTNGYYTDINVQDSCNTLAIFGCTDSLAFNYDSNANVDNGGCVPVIIGCMQPLAFNYNPNANTSDTCIPIIYGCTSPIAFNYDSLANTDDGSCVGVTYGCTDSTMLNYSPSANTDDGSCIPFVYGCMDPTMWNYDPQANTDNGSCIAFIYGCTDSTMFNYDPLANTDNGTCVPYVYGCTNPIALNYCDSCNIDDFSCILPIYGCTDSTMFNYNPLANVDNNSCIPYIYGCTDPSMLNYNPQANTEDFSCIAYVYGCTDSTAFNYDSTANTDNGSCVATVEGCMDPSAHNYSASANVNDSVVCLYSAGCITGAGNPYWLNDPCYAWVISVDDYCCENEWDTICQSTYDYCEGTWVGPPLARSVEENLVVYPNPTSGIININKKVDVRVFNVLGDVIILENNINVLDVSYLIPGIYNMQIMYDNKVINRKIIKE